MKKLEKALEIRKAKYIKRTGSPGKYKYIYKVAAGRKKKTAESEEMELHPDTVAEIEEEHEEEFAKEMEEEYLEEERKKKLREKKKKKRAVSSMAEAIRQREK